jgi:hypothetical protein
MITYSNILSQSIYCSKDSLTYGKNDYKALDSVIICNHDNVDLRIDSIFTKRFYYKIQTQFNGVIKNWGSISMRNCPHSPITIPSNDSIKLLIRLMVPTGKISALSSLTIDSLYIYNNSRNKNLLSLSVYNYITMDVGKNQYYPIHFFLSQNYPNPFNPVTTIKYFVPKSGKVSIKIYNVLGKEITTLLNEYQPTGDYEIQFNGSSLSSGVYVYGIVTNNHAYYNKMVLLK